MEYEPLYSGLGNSIELLKISIDENLREISQEISQVKQLHMVKWAAEPDRFVNGDVYYFLADVLYTDQPEGLFVWIDPSWRQLNYRSPFTGTMYAVTPTSIVVTGTTGAQVDQFDTIGIEDIVDVDLANDDLTILVSGRYLVQSHIVFNNQSNNIDWIYELLKDGVVVSAISDATHAKGVNDPASMALFGVADFVAGEVLTVQIRKVQTGNQTVPVIAASFSMVRQ